MDIQPIILPFIGGEIRLPLTPYFFLIVGETLTQLMKNNLREGNKIKGVKLPKSKEHVVKSNTLMICPLFSKNVKVQPKI
jgi:hypothetical protein